MRIPISLTCALLLSVIGSPAFGGPMSPPFNLGGAKPYSLLQLGNQGGDGGNKLEITSNSSVFGSTLKGVDDAGEDNKLTSNSAVRGSWDRETGVDNDLSSSFTGSQATLSQSDFNDIAADAVKASQFWAGQAGTGISINLNSGATQTVMGSTGGANVFDVTGGFILNSGAKLTLTGDPGDFFVFNIPEDLLFSIQSNSIIELAGDIEATEVLFNVLGNIDDPGPDDALIGGGSIFQGTLLAPGRKVEITQNHFFTFMSGSGQPGTTEITAAAAIAEKEQNDSSWGGLFGQIVAGGTLNFTESDISHQPFMTSSVPIPSTLLFFGLGFVGFAAWRYRVEKLSKI